MDSTRPVIDWGVAGRPCEGETESGDAHTIKNLPDRTLIAVIDGLGHGIAAAQAARTAVAVVESNAAYPLRDIMSRCHEALRGTRGAVMTIASIAEEAGTLTWLGVGNVVAALVRVGERTDVREVLVLRGGLLGHQFSNAATVTVPIVPGDTLILATDGTRWNPNEGRVRITSPGRMAAELLEENATTDDDALVVVARYR